MVLRPAFVRSLLGEAGRTDDRCALSLIVQLGSRVSDRARYRSSRRSGRRALLSAHFRSELCAGEVLLATAKQGCRNSRDTNGPGTLIVVQALLLDA